MKIVEEKKTIKEIPAIIVRKNDGVKKPLVIFSHGFGGSKNNINEKGYLRKLAELGYCAVAIDNQFHGDRIGPDFNTAIIEASGNVNLYKLRKAIKETADDIKQLIDELLKSEEIDRDRIAMMGVSMGGFITYRSIAIDKRIKVGIPTISSPFWDDIPGDIPTLKEDDMREELKLLTEKFQPSKNLESFFPTALLIQVGALDRHYDVNKVSNFCHELEHYYLEEPEKLKLIIYPNMGHEFNDEMWEQALQWLEKNL